MSTRHFISHVPRTNAKAEAIRGLLCGTRAVFEVILKPGKGRFEVRGATSGHVIHSYAYDERRVYSDDRLRLEGCTPEKTPQAYANLSKVTFGRSREEAHEAANNKAVATSAKVTEFDR